MCIRDRYFYGEEFEWEGERSNANTFNIVSRAERKITDSDAAPFSFLQEETWKERRKKLVEEAIPPRIPCIKKRASPLEIALSFLSKRTLRLRRRRRRRRVIVRYVNPLSRKIYRVETRFNPGPM